MSLISISAHFRPFCMPVSFLFDLAASFFMCTCACTLTWLCMCVLCVCVCNVLSFWRLLLYRTVLKVHDVFVLQEFNSIVDVVEHFKVVSLNLKSDNQVQGTHNLTVPAPKKWTKTISSCSFLLFLLCGLFSLYSQRGPYNKKMPWTWLPASIVIQIYFVDLINLFMESKKWNPHELMQLICEALIFFCVWGEGLFVSFVFALITTCFLRWEFQSCFSTADAWLGSMS